MCKIDFNILKANIRLKLESFGIVVAIINLIIVIAATIFSILRLIHGVIRHGNDAFIVGICFFVFVIIFLVAFVSFQLIDGVGPSKDNIIWFKNFCLLNVISCVMMITVSLYKPPIEPPKEKAEKGVIVVISFVIFLVSIYIIFCFYSLYVKFREDRVHKVDSRSSSLAG